MTIIVVGDETFTTSLVPREQHEHEDHDADPTTEAHDFSKDVVFGADVHIGTGNKYSWLAKSYSQAEQSSIYPMALLDLFGNPIFSVNGWGHVETPILSAELSVQIGDASKYEWNILSYTAAEQSLAEPLILIDPSNNRILKVVVSQPVHTHPL